MVRRSLPHVVNPFRSSAYLATALRQSPWSSLPAQPRSSRFARFGSLNPDSAAACISPPKTFAALLPFPNL